MTIYTHRSRIPNAFVLNFGYSRVRPVYGKDPVRMQHGPVAPVPRRTVIRALLALPALLLSRVTDDAIASPTDIEDYDVFKSRRYIDIGPPSPTAKVPGFSSAIPVFSIDDKLQAQDVSTGEGAPITGSTLVVARWIVRLSDGTLVDDSNAQRPVLFRPYAHQVSPGIEDSVVGMRKGGHRLVSGSAERILT